MGIFGQLSATQKKVLLFFIPVTLVLVLAGVIYIFPSPSNQGYAPEQPIPFSHKLHAGQYKIDCRYCHFGAWKSQHAGIPPMNVCMNCHRVVKTDSPYIQQLTKAYHEGKPIEWVRIHELPDHARFNHRPHVMKGINCTTCHGEVAQMDRVVQKQPLTMGWCLSCHRGKDVPFEVERLIEEGQKQEDGSIAPSSCYTCHY